MLRTAACTALALLAFAGNSILCRLALRREAIDPASFSSVRLVAGALTLAFLVRWTRGAPRPQAGPSWISAAALFLYAVPFSFAYVSLDAGVGALLLFGAVQLTMILAAVRRGDRPGRVQWLGLALASGGLLYLVLPGLSAPPPAGSALMLLAGMAWGIYSLRGGDATDPLAETAVNFARAVPLALVVSLLTPARLHIERSGFVLALASGAVASGLGYVLWYQALRGLSAVTASVVQLSVPVLAAVGGILLLDERVTSRLLLAALLVLGGVGLAILGRPERFSKSQLLSSREQKSRRSI
jgi:drug/metabolite transporter (DMT)-like permease